MDRLISSAAQLASLLKTTRKAQGLTQAMLAARLGISQNRLSELEAHAGAMTIERLLDIARALQLELVLRPAGQDTGAGAAGPSAPSPW